MLDVVVHEQGLVTEWAQTDCVGDVRRRLRAPGLLRRSPPTPRWVVLVGDLTALPAIARISEALDASPVRRACVESPDGPLAGYLAGRD